MKNVLIVGGGLAGCVAARELSDAGISSLLLESAAALGGKVRDYGCKADNRCNQCGVCLAGNLWERVESDPNIAKRFRARLLDLHPDPAGYTAYIKTDSLTEQVHVTDVILASGFTDYAGQSKGAAEVACSARILTGNELERLLAARTSGSLFDEAPQSVAFVLCFGSRDVREHAQYCSRVCCGYATRAAKVIRHCYPDADIVFFYMDLQSVGSSLRYSDELKDLGIRLERCRPARIAMRDGSPRILYESTVRQGVAEEAFDRVILCGGIHPGTDHADLSEITGLRVDENGFLQAVAPPEETHIYLAGCVSGPKNIRESADDATVAAMRIIAGGTEADARL